LKNTIKVINAYVHDFASALWLVTVLVIYWTNRFNPPAGSEDFFLGFKKEFFYIGVASLIVIVLTGIGRTLLYESGEYGEDSEQKRKKILIVKHILGIIIYGAGTYWQYIMVYV
jgi:uncharacterized membrane protein